MKIADGRLSFYQWESNQKIEIPVKCAEVHFDNGTLDDAIPVEVKNVDGRFFCDVPDEMLQTAAQLRAHAWNAERTCVVDFGTFMVDPRPKPANYVYTKTEMWTAEKAVADALQAAKESGEFDGKDGYTPKKGVDYYTEVDTAEMVAAVLNALPVYNGEVESV